MQPNRTLTLPVLTASMLLATAAPAATQYLYVDRTAPIGGDGADWCTAFPSLAAALDEAAGIVITTGDDVVLRLAQGIYRPDRGPGRTLNDPTERFEIENGVSILGGYEGGCGGDLTRNIDLYPTVLTGDIGVLGDAGDNSYRVLWGDYVGPSSSIDGVTIKNGHGDDSGAATTDSGAGLRLDYSSLTISRCRFIGNVATRGGAAYSGESDLTFVDCVFELNHAPSGNGGAIESHDGSLSFRGCAFTQNTAQNGGAIVTNDTELLVTNCEFSQNEAEFGGAIEPRLAAPVEIRGSTFTGNTASIRGGALQLGQSGDAILVSCTLEGNSAEGDGGAIFKYDYSLESRLWISTCHFANNAAGGGGGALYSVDDISLSNSVFEGNSADWGGAIVQIRQDPVFSQLTIVGNSASIGGAVYVTTGADGFDAYVTIANSIVWDNGSDPIHVGGTSSAWARSSDLEGSGGSGAGWAWPGVTDDGGNIDADPQFISATFPFDLAMTSPCIDAGDDGWVSSDWVDVDEDGDTTEDLPWDIEGDAHVIGGSVDMGANEYAGPVGGVPGDADGDGDVDFDDLLLVLIHWGTDGSGDVTGDGVVDFADILVVLANWS